MFFRVLCVLEGSPRLCPLSNQFVGLSKVDAVINDRLAYVAYNIYKNLSLKRIFIYPITKYNSLTKPFDTTSILNFAKSH